MRTVVLFACLVAFSSLATAQDQPPVTEGSVLDVRGAYVQLDQGGYVNFRIIDRRIHVFYLDQDLRIQPIPDVRLSVRFEVATPNRASRTRTRMLFKDESGLFFSHPTHVRSPWDFWVWPIIIHPDDTAQALPRTRFRQEWGTDTFEIEKNIPDGR